MAMASLKRQLNYAFQVLISQRDQLQLQLSQAQETISLLETEINAIKYHGDGAFDKVVETANVTRHTFELVSEPTPTSYWLQDLWLSDPRNAPLLGDAEAAWKVNGLNPQKALNIVGKVLTGDITQSERIKCSLFVVALMLASGKTEEACAGANEMLRLCGNDFRSRDLAAIAHYLRGRVFLQIKSLRQAYWDFSLAVFAPGYHERVKHFQHLTETLILQELKQEQLSNPSKDGLKDKVSLEHTPSQRPSLKLAAETQLPLDEVKFKKAPTAPIPSNDDAPLDSIEGPNPSGPLPS